jgi:hypothetical protein
VSKNIYGKRGRGLGEIFENKIILISIKERMESICNLILSFLTNKIDEIEIIKIEKLKQLQLV